MTALMPPAPELDVFTSELDRYIIATSAADRLADLSTAVNRDRWRTYLDRLPGSVSIQATDGFLSRTALFDLAAFDRREQSDHSVMELFWNVMAWGIAGSWRNVPALVAHVGKHHNEVVTILRQAQQLSFHGSVDASFRALQGKIKYFGPAFFTKFLHFTANKDSPGRALILDDRVRVAWRILAGEWLKAGSGKAYARYCSEAGDVAARLHLEASEVEACLYHLGRKTQTYEAWLLADLRLCQVRLNGRTPTIAEVLSEVEAAPQAS